MKTRFFVLLLLLGLSVKKVSAQYCFWVANQSDETFYALKIRVNGSGNSFGSDLLPYNLIRSDQHFWVRTSSSHEIWDVQITRLDGSPLLFTYRDRGGVWHRNQRFITVNAKLLHTLVIQEDDDGRLTFGYYTTDQFDYGHPCDN